MWRKFEAGSWTLVCFAAEVLLRTGCSTRFPKAYCAETNCHLRSHTECSRVPVTAGTEKVQVLRRRTLLVRRYRVSEFKNIEYANPEFPGLPNALVIMPWQYDRPYHVIVCKE